MEILRGIPPEFWPKFLAGVASTILVAVLVKGSLFMSKLLRKRRFRKPSNLWEPKPGANPKLLVEEVFFRLSDLDRMLERISSPREVDPVEFGLFLFFLCWQISAAFMFSSLPALFAWLNVLAICFITAGIVALCRPEKTVLVLTVFPLSILFFATNLARGSFDQRRAEAIGKCRWHLLLAIPS